MDLRADPTCFDDEVPVQHKKLFFTVIASHKKLSGCSPSEELDWLMQVADLDPTDAGSQFNMFGQFTIPVLAEQFGGEDQLEAKLSALVEQCEGGSMIYGEQYLPHFRHGLQRVKDKCGGYTFA